MTTETDVFKVKKSSYSRRLAKQSGNRRNKKEVKKEPKKEDNNSVDENNIKNKNELKSEDDLNVIWIKSEEIKETEPKEELKIFAGDQIESDDEYEAEEYRNNEPFHHFRGALERGVIPDAKTIYELKKKRQMARDIEELIIPIEDDDKYEESDSRVVREDDDDKSDDEDDERISFAINKDNIERERQREAFLKAQEEDEDQSDKESESEDELDRWEREQIKKGVRMPVVQMLSQEQAANRAVTGLFVDNLSVVDMDIDRPFSRPKKSTSIPSKVLNFHKNKNPITLEEVVDRVGQQLKILKESIAFNERQVVTLTADFNESKQQIERLSQKRQQLIERADKEGQH